MRGPNYWSIRRHKLIVMTLDLEELEDYPTNKIDGFLRSIRLLCFLPCTNIDALKVGKPGGFFSKSKGRNLDGTCHRTYCPGNPNACRNGCRIWKNTRLWRGRRLSCCFCLHRRKSGSLCCKICYKNCSSIGGWKRIRSRRYSGNA